MKKNILVLIVLFCMTTVFAADSNNVFKKFVYCQADKLMDENGQLRFISFNIPCLHYNEDNVSFSQTNPWRLTNEFEINDALEAVRQMGGQVIRIYTLSVRRKGEDPNIPRHITVPGQFDEKTFIPLDRILAVANQKGIRVIIPFIDNWKWWGGIKACAEFRGKGAGDFWTDEQLFEDYKQIVSFVINRTNTITGVKYKDDKAILAWETGNELACPVEWTAKAAAFIKSIDQNHLVIDGYHTETLRAQSLEDKNIDVITTHHYSKNPADTISQIKKNVQMSGGKKPYFVGEFGFIPTKDIQAILDAVIGQKAAGALIWSLRFRNRDGGFYWHSEPAGGDLFKAYHWPGFASGAAYDEENLMSLMRNKAFEIRNLAIPSFEKPTAPFLLDITDNSQISWQGSAGAQSYIVERATNKNGPWVVAARDISDAAVQYRPLFADTTAEPQAGCYYRVKAQNAAGVSKPSNVVGPVYAFCRTLVDEMQNLSLIKSYKGQISIETKQARKFKEDIHRLAGNNGTAVIYNVNEPVLSWKLYAFFPDKIHNFKFSASEDGKEFKKIECEYTDCGGGKGDYGYYRPVLYTGALSPNNYKYLKIEYAAKAEIGRVEIKYGKQSSRFSHTYSPIGFVKGFSWGWTGWRGQYLGDEPADSMKKLARTNADWVCISFGAEM